MKIYPKETIRSALNATDRLFWDVEAWTRNDQDADMTRKILIDAHTGEVVADDPVPPAYVMPPVRARCRTKMNRDAKA